MIWPLKKKICRIVGISHFVGFFLVCPFFYVRQRKLRWREKNIQNCIHATAVSYQVLFHMYIRSFALSLSLRIQMESSCTKKIGMYSRQNFWLMCTSTVVHFLCSLALFFPALRFFCWSIDILEYKRAWYVVRCCFIVLLRANSQGFFLHINVW